MFAILLMAAVLTTALNAPAVLPNDTDHTVHLTLFGRELPPCMDIKLYRTKQDIVWSCLATIFACTWVAIHPNVPDQYYSEWQKLGTRVYTMFYALIGPEFIMMWALRQRIGAAKHVAEYNQKFFPGLTPKSWVERVEEWFRKPDLRTDGPWTLVHGFLLEMHGVQLKNGGELRTVDFLHKPIELPENEINDKSKGDFLTKLVVVVQTTWFIVQCLARWATRLPVTELEVVTLAFAVLNVITYALWWNKPQSMRVPMRVQEGDEVELRQDWRELVMKEDARAEWNDREKTLATIPVHGDSGLRELLYCVSRRMWGFVCCIKESTMRLVEKLVTFCQLALQGIRYYLSSLGDYLGDIAEDAEEKNRHMKGFIMIWYLLLAIIAYILLPFDGMMDGNASLSSAIDFTFYSSEGGLFFVSPKVLATTFVVSLIFGGIHLIPIWTVTFQSSVERRLWQVSSLCIIVAPAMVLVGRFILRWETRRSQISSMIILAVSGLLYVVARIILLTIAFTTLRDLPQDAYRNIDWMTLFPHF